MNLIHVENTAQWHYAMSDKVADQRDRDRHLGIADRLMLVAHYMRVPGK